MDGERYCQAFVSKRKYKLEPTFVCVGFALNDLQMKRLFLPIINICFFMMIVGVLMVVGAGTAEAVKSTAFNPTGGIEPLGVKTYDDDTLSEKTIRRCLLLEAELE
ncbi:MAG TPA: hypothetical protein VJ969_11470, partial [Desulfopila sp.]|nr:hypothetical protein [Desulfopila sp.]